jgi:hypothetical protein
MQFTMVTMTLEMFEIHIGWYGGVHAPNSYIFALNYLNTITPAM